MEKLKFRIKDNGTIRSYLEIENDNEVIVEKIEDEKKKLEKLFDYAIDYVTKRNMDYERRLRKIGNIKTLEVEFEDGRTIVKKFYDKQDKEKNILDENLKLKRKIVGTAITSFAGILGLTFAIKIGTPKKENISENEAATSTVPYKDKDILEDMYKITISDELLKAHVAEKDKEEVKIEEVESYEKLPFTYEDRSEYNQVKKASRYDKYFEEVGKTYGIDKNLLKAIMCQESGGVHINGTVNGHAYGGMQIENIIFGHTIHAYNFDKEKEEDLTISKSQITDVGYNIKVAAMLLQYHLKHYNYDIEKALQAYNFGEGNMRKLGSNWKASRKTLGVGDPEYIEHVLSFLPNKTILTFKEETGKEKKVITSNSKVKDKTNENINNISKKS